MNSILIVFLGGGLGSVARYALGKGVNMVHTQNFPWGTLAVNGAACLLLGVIVGIADHRQLISAPARLFWTVGFCGGFSTFSTFSHETIQLMQSGFTLNSIAYILSSLLLCVATTFLGLYAGENL